MSAGSRTAAQDGQQAHRAALSRAAAAAFPAGEYVGQESFVRASEVRRLAARAGIGPGVAVLDICCGTAGPGRMLTAELGCRYRGVDSSAGALAAARELAGDLPCSFERAQVPPLPDGPADVVLLLETMLAFGDKAALLAEVARVLGDGGRFACTLEEGPPLTAAERERMPAADTVRLVGLGELTVLLGAAGLTVTHREEWTAAHAATAAALLRCYRAASDELGDRIGAGALADLLAAHELWADWLARGRVRKYALVAQKR
ncbi:class I SAM-dependent methyltransferase [Trujillonella humicola]|uniref:class I SAM-dependent methyltransferase n=1 Tax=Trujillonella humicola TaxID=3383699 RepID=UPI00390667F7